MQPFGPGFCKDTFWDSAQTWHTAHPRLSGCFLQTVLVWIPMVYVLMMLPSDVHTLISCQKKKMSCSKLLLLKMMLITTLILTALVEFVFVVSYWHFDGSVHFAQADLLAPVFRFSTMMLELISVAIAARYSHLNSGKHFFFWMLMCLTTAPGFLMALHPGYKLFPDIFEFAMRSVWLAVSLLQFALNFINEATTADCKLELEKYASFPSRILFSYCHRMGFLGWKKSITQADLWCLMEDEAAHTLTIALQRNWNTEVCKSKRTERYQPSLKIALWKTFWKKIVFTGILRLLDEALVLLMPFLLQLLINFMAVGDYQWKGYCYAFLILIVCCTQTVLNNYYLSSCFRFGMCLKSAISCLIYRKALRLNSSAKQENTLGEVINLMAVDAQRFMSVTGYLHSIWARPIGVVLVIFFLYLVFGYAAVAGLGVVLLTLPVNAWLFHRVGVLHGQQMVFKDDRINLMAEILHGMKLLKLYAWEEAFQKRITNIRSQELESLRSASHYGIFTYCSWVLFPFCTGLAVFASYVLVDDNNNLTPGNIFIALLLINILRAPAGLLAPAISQLLQVLTAEKRVRRFLLLSETDGTYVSYVSSTSDTALEIVSGSFSWAKNNPSILHDIHIKVPKGALVAVIGPVGAGKSSLCAAMLGMMEKSSGSVCIAEFIAYIPQQAWIQNLSVRDNILFGRPMQPELYQRVVEGCALTADLASLPLGDTTEIGERGADLSGGQRQRINLARAAYSDADVYIIDDALSAVDSSVARDIFHNIIGPNGLLKGKTRIFVTHGIAFLPQTDLIIVVAGGRVTEVQTFENLQKNSSGLLRLLSTVRKDADQAQVEAVAAMSWSDSGAVTKADKAFFPSSAEIADVHVGGSGVDKSPSKDEYTHTDVGWGVYVTLAKCFTYPVVLGIFLLFTLYTAGGFASSFWLTTWAAKSATMSANSRLFYLGIYGIFGVAQASFLLGFALCLARGRLRASQSQHELLLDRILHCPMSFFDNTPIGRIHTRFSRDMDTVDLAIPANIEFYFYNLFAILGTVCLICITTPYLSAVFLPLMLIYYFMQRLYVTTTRQINRLESLSRAPVLSHMQESMAGIGVIRAAGQIDRFIHENESLVDKNMQAVYVEIIVSRWIAVRLEFLGIIVTFLVALLAVVGRERSWGMSAVDAGLALSYSMTVTLLINWLLWAAGDLESNVVSVERIDQYMNAPQEASWKNPKFSPHENWPSAGAINFYSYMAGYHEGASELVLKGLTASVVGGEKVGIVGRTGAGKSSLALALFRIIEAHAGRIDIDNLNIAELGLHDLRRRITILPQEPTLFSGTIRSSLDPMEQYSDDQIWAALEQCNLNNYVMGLPQRLAHRVASGGQNYRLHTVARTATITLKYN
ncbi:multidrug resistance-associated protein 1-like isoform X2 [Paramacrobiotus metropolitanus]|uniref:multidrug resistance-associated protein 1-like isoform X2 n=1 Tax=Paramacrobiotus metropolitanus TaxID=2943436 RepID=UPI002445DE7E|nr:multidrug resistance-associated protein 1-like isoform X2 [Paramacrobiotus metropolitanus]